MEMINLFPLFPLIEVALGGMIVLLIAAFSKNRLLPPIVALISCGFAILSLRPGPDIIFSNAIIIDGFSRFSGMLLVFVVAGTIIISFPYLARENINISEYYSLLLFSLFGMLMMVSAIDLMVFFLGLEIMSIPIYVLVGIRRGNASGNESSFKYFVLGGLGSGMLIYGIALLYGAVGTLHLEEIANQIASGNQYSQGLLLAAVGLILIGLLFKIAAVPFHAWTPDVYQGAPTPITGFMAAGVKIAVICGVIRVMKVALPEASVYQKEAVWIIAAATMVYGNLVAIAQSNIKRMLAYSSIAHGGYMLIGFLAMGGEKNLAVYGLLYYLLAYGIVTLGVFAVVALLEGKSETQLSLENYRGLGGEYPWIGILFAVLLLSLAGFPPTMGFLGKLYIFSAAINQGFVWIVIIAVLCSFVSVFYYIRPIVYFFMTPLENHARTVSPSRSLLLIGAGGFCGLVILISGFNPFNFFIIPGAEQIHQLILSAAAAF